MRTSKTRHQFYLPADLSQQLEALALEPGSSKTAILTDAFRAWLDRRAGNELDERFALRLERFGRGQKTLEDKLDFLAEALGTFVQHQLTLVAHQPSFTPEAALLGQQRYQKFVDAVGRKLARATEIHTVRAPADGSLVVAHDLRPVDGQVGKQESAIGEFTNPVSFDGVATPSIG